MYATISGIRQYCLRLNGKQNLPLKKNRVSVRHMDADEKLTKIDMKIRYYDVTLKFLEEIIRNISGRTYQIKNAIEWQRFQSGF